MCTCDTDAIDLIAKPELFFQVTERVKKIAITTTQIESLDISFVIFIPPVDVFHQYLFDDLMNKYHLCASTYLSVPISYLVPKIHVNSSICFKLDIVRESKFALSKKYM